MSIEFRQQISEANVHTNFGDVEFWVEDLLSGTAMLTIRTVNWHNKSVTVLKVFGNPEEFRNLEHALSVYNQERLREEYPDTNIPVDSDSGSTAAVA